MLSFAVIVHRHRYLALGSGALMLRPRPEIIPDTLTAIPRWVAWKLETKNGKPTKVPYTPRSDERALSKASSTDPATWRDFPMSLHTLEHDATVTGIGFALNGDGLCGVDFDHCRDADTGELNARVTRFLEMLNSYTEISPSGTGVRVFVHGELPEGPRKNTKEGIEMYADGRYLTVTGHHLEAYPVDVCEAQAALETMHAELFPAPVKPVAAAPRATLSANMDDHTLLEQARDAKNGARFRKLYGGDFKSAGYSSQSEADLALCGSLRFWTGGDMARVDTLFRLSGLMRPKWDKRHSSDGQTYGQMTLERVASDGGDVYTSENGVTRGGVDSDISNVDTFAALDTEAPPELDDAALYGLAGDVVRLIEPETEAHPASLLFSFFVAVGIALGNGVGWKIGGVSHPLRFFMVLIGISGIGRKGTSWGAIRGVVINALGEDFYKKNVTAGLSSGEGLIHAMRDPITKMVKAKDGTLEETTVDEGVEDKRLIVLESEFGRVLKVMQRDGSTLSPVIRQAWEIGVNDPLNVMTKNSLTATGAHVGILGHCTRDELLRYLEDTETANGFANRFLWVRTRRVRELPFGGNPDAMAINQLGQRLRDALQWVNGTNGVVTWHETTRPLWAAIYGELSAGPSGLSGAVTSRAEAYVTRMAGLYAVLDQTLEVRPEHLLAAMAAWKYCADSVAGIFGRRTGDVIADAILEALKVSKRLTKTQVSQLFNKNQTAGAIDRAAQLLIRDGKARTVMGERENGGRAPQYLELVEVTRG